MDSHGTIYAAAYQQGIWRSMNGGSTWEQVFATQDPTENTARTEFALNTTAGGHTRIYVGDGGTETDGAFPPHSNTGVYRADSIDTKTSAQLTNGTANPGFVSLTTPSRADPTYDYCETQCWYDNVVVSPAGHPDMVYIARFLRLQPVRQRDQQRPRCAALAERRQHVDRPDTGQRESRRPGSTPTSMPWRSTRRIRCSSSRARTVVSSTRAAS